MLALLIVAFFIVRPAGAPGVAMRDFEAFYAAGAAANRDEDPYARDIWFSEQRIPGVDASHNETLPFVGPQAGLPLWRALARLPFDVAGRVWGAVLALALVVVVFGSLSLARAPRKPSVLLGAAMLAASFGPLISDVALGQVAIVSAAGIVATLLLLRSSRAWRWSALSSAVATLQPSLVLPLIARLGDVRAFAGLALGAMFFLVWTLMYGGIAGLAHYVHLLSVHGAAEAATVIQITPASVARGFGATPNLVQLVTVASASAAVLLSALAARRIDDPTLRVGVASCALPFVIPFIHEHDFVLTLLPAICCAVRARGTVLGFSAVAVTACGVDWLGLGQRPNGDVQSVVLAFACALAFALVAQLRREAFAALIVPFAVAGVAVVAHAHPVPVWPDTLPPHWQPPVTATISQVWALEQSVAGLDQKNAVWSALRALVLLSSLLVAIATFATGKLEERVDTVSRRDERMGLRGLASPVLPEGLGPP